MKIVIVSAFYSEGMGYSENSLPKALASMGHEVHVVTSNLNVYGNEDGYKKTYEFFLGPADQGTGEFDSVGYKVTRLNSRIVSGYVYITGLYKKIKELKPDIVQVTEIASLNCFKLALIKPLLGFKLFTESHQHLSVVKPYVKNPKLDPFKNIIYKLTRTFPSFMASLMIEKCYAIAPDCVEVANKFYGVPKAKVRLQPLGTDTILFSPSINEIQQEERKLTRQKLGYNDDDIVCIYTGRFSEDKNPLLLAEAVHHLVNKGLNFHCLFIGEGIQRDEMLKRDNVTILDFMKHSELAVYYRAADVGVWPKQESMSMLDGASSGLPLVVTDAIGELERVNGNGRTYIDGNLDSLINTIESLSNKDERIVLGKIGSKKMVEKYSWINIAKNIERDYLVALQ